MRAGEQGCAKALRSTSGSASSTSSSCRSSGQFANDLFTEGQGRRLFPFIGVGQSLGVVGAATVVPLVERLRFTPFTLMFAAAVVLVAALGITVLVNRRESSAVPADVANAGATAARQAGWFDLGALGSLLDVDCRAHDPLNVVNTTGEDPLNLMVETQAAAQFGTHIRRSLTRAGGT